MSASTSEERHGPNLLDVDVVVIGLGSGGEQVAKSLAGGGMAVVGFEHGRVGGECPFVACIPSKAMLHDTETDRTWSEAVARRDELADHRDDQGHAEGLVEAGVDLRRSTARITGERTVEADGLVVHADHVVIATGAEAIRLEVPGADRPEVWYSADALSSDRRPERLVIIGGGAIGCELAQVYRAFETEVTLVDHGSSLVGDVEPDVSEILETTLTDLGVDLRLERSVEAIEEAAAGVTVRLDNGSEVSTDAVLVAIGVEPRLSSIGLESLDIDPAEVSIDSMGRVAGLEWLSAVGDVTPQSQWTHGATYQARMLTDRLHGAAWPTAPQPFPRCVYTHPPVGAVGMTEEEARSDGCDVVVGRGRIDDTARGATDEAGDGLACVVVDAPSGRLLGASMVGPRADDLVQIVTALMVGDVGIERAARMVFAFPTYAQMVEAALDDAAARRRTMSDGSKAENDE